MVKILIDSASDIEKDEADALGVHLIPVRIRFGTEEFLDGINLTHLRFFEMLIESDELPQTSRINEYEFAEKYGELTADGSDVVVITMSSKISGTYSGAVKAAKDFGGKVYVVDSLNACIGERILCQYALRLLGEGLSAREIAAELDVKKHKIQLLAVLDTLKYLRKGGRISAAAAFTGELLSIKPVISIIKGEVKLVGKAIGSKKGNNLLTQLVDRCGGIDFGMPYGLVYSGLSDDYLNKYLNDSAKLWKDNTDFVPSYLIGSTIGTHIGPGAVGVCFFAKD
ncbi:MAG: DegV family protein [Clostridia bacterium]|jgi:DegV family protein with EDD domain|nr:DegV family protein [Clostridia bacterium]